MAYSADEVKHIRDKALALQIYAAPAKNVEAERQACEIRLRAERRAGALIKAMEKAKPGPAPLDRSRRVSDPETLSDLGISHNQSAKWQKLAEIPDDIFEEALSNPDVMPSTTGIIAAHAAPKVSPVDPLALWL